MGMSSNMSNMNNMSNMSDQIIAGFFKVRIKLIIFKCPVNQKK